MLGRCPAFVLIALTFAISGSAFARATWTVAPSGPADFTEISAAIAAASDGDVILVAPGGYAPIIIDGKGLWILGSGATVTSGLGPNPPPGSEVTIRNVGANQRCVIENLNVTSFALASGAFLIEDCAGPVWVQNSFFDTFAATSLAIEDCASVVVVNCFMQCNTAPAAPDGTPQPLPGTRVVRSRVSIFDSTTTGSHGPFVGLTFPTPSAPPPGGAGLLVVDSIVDVAGSTIRGGSGSIFVSGGCVFGGKGGDGVVLATAGGTAPLVRLRDVVVQPGDGGFFHPSCAPTPANGDAQVVLAGSIVNLPGKAPVMQAQGIATSGTIFELTLAGAPQGQALLFAGVPALPITLLPSTAAISLLLASPAFLAAIPMPASGSLVIDFELPPQAPGTPIALAALQAIFVPVAGAPVASNPLGIGLR
jgi:hypothetical protein